jgi:hypothetical protein
MYTERMAQHRLKKIKKEFVEHFDKRNEYIIDKIFQGNIIVMGPENLIKYLSDQNIKIEAMRYEDKLTGYIYVDRNEFHTLYLAEKNEDLKKFLAKVSRDHDINIDAVVGFSIFNDKDSYGISLYDMKRIKELKDKEYNRDNVKKIIEHVLPKADNMFKSAVKDSIHEFTEKVMLSELVMMTMKNKKNIEKNSRKE